MIALSTPVPLVPFVCVDVETTGLDPRRDRITEIAAVRVSDGKGKSRRSWNGCA
jgi:DNA polymerase III epsilon subunit-like protein